MKNSNTPPTLPTVDLCWSQAAGEEMFSSGVITLNARPRSISASPGVQMVFRYPTLTNEALLLLRGGRGGSRCCFSSQASTFQVVNRELSRFPRTRAGHVWVRALAFLARNSAGAAIKTSMRSSKRGSSFSFFVLFFFPLPPTSVCHTSGSSFEESA